MTDLISPKLKLWLLRAIPDLPAADQRALEIWLALVGPRFDVSVLSARSIARIGELYHHIFIAMGHV